MTFDEIEDAFFFVSMSEDYMNSATVCKKTGKIYYESDMGISDELPEDIDDLDQYIEIPGKNELDLGENLVFDFVSEFLSDKYDDVSNIFRRKGAYSRYKDFLENRGVA